MTGLAVGSFVIGEICVAIFTIKLDMDIIKSKTGNCVIEIALLPPGVTSGTLTVKL
jgi:hypothetical protein